MNVSSTLPVFLSRSGKLGEGFCIRQQLRVVLRSRTRRRRRSSRTGCAGRRPRSFMSSRSIFGHGVRLLGGPLQQLPVRLARRLDDLPGLDHATEPELAAVGLHDQGEGLLRLVDQAVRLARRSGSSGTRRPSAAAAAATFFGRVGLRPGMAFANGFSGSPCVRAMSSSDPTTTRRRTRAGGAGSLWTYLANASGLVHGLQRALSRGHEDRRTRPGSGPS